MTQPRSGGELLARRLFERQSMPASVVGRHAMFAWLASPAGAQYLGSLKDEQVYVLTRVPGATYASVAAGLGVSKDAINAAVTRYNRVRREQEETAS